jgi:hypothetical protein
MTHHQNSDWELDLPWFSYVGYWKCMFVDFLIECMGPPKLWPCCGHFQPPLDKFGHRIKSKIIYEYDEQVQITKIVIFMFQSGVEMYIS